MSRDRVVLACCSDAAYAPHAATMLLSALERTAGAPFTVHYLVDPDFPEATRETVRGALARHAARLELHFHTVPDQLVEGLPLFSHMKAGSLRPVMWYRLFLPELLPQEDKVLYIDCDTLVTDNLLPLWNTELGEQALAAVTNPSWKGDMAENWAERCGLARREDYFNTGVMLLNLAAFRRHGWTQQVLAHGRANADWTRFGDQDSLVVVLHKHRLPMDPRWNVMRIVALSGDSRTLFTAEQMRDVIRRPGIIHFEGSTKPWMDATKHPYGRLHQRYARQLPWPVRDVPWQWQDLDNFLIRRDWQRLQRLFGKVRNRLRRITR